LVDGNTNLIQSLTDNIIKNMLYNQTQLIIISKKLFNKSPFLLTKNQRQQVLEIYNKTN